MTLNTAAEMAEINVAKSTNSRNHRGAGRYGQPVDHA